MNCYLMSPIWCAAKKAFVALFAMYRFMGISYGSNFVVLIFFQFSHIFSHDRNWHKNEMIQKLTRLKNLVKLTKNNEVPDSSKNSSVFWKNQRHHNLLSRFTDKTPILPNCQVQNGYFRIMSFSLVTKNQWLNTIYQFLLSFLFK